MVTLRQVITRFVLVFLLPVSLTASGAEAETWSERLELAGGLPVVSVWIGGRGPWRFAIDTGAEGSSVSPSLAQRLALPAIGRLDDHTVTGIATIPVVRLQGLRIGRGGPAIRDLTAGVVDLDALRLSASRIDGVLGGDALSGFDYAIDFVSARLHLARGEALSFAADSDAVVLPLQFERHRPLVRWPRPPNPAPLLLVVDTGSNALIVDRREADSFACRPRTALVMRLDTHAGSRDVESCELMSLGGGAIDVAGLRMVAIAWPVALARSDRGLLPASAFARVRVSTIEGTLTLWPR